MKQHSTHWTSNSKQHSAFILIASALLKHILDANRPDQAQLASQMTRMSSNIDALLNSPRNLQMSHVSRRFRRNR